MIQSNFSLPARYISKQDSSVLKSRSNRSKRFFDIALPTSGINRMESNVLNNNTPFLILKQCQRVIHRAVICSTRTPMLPSIVPEV